MTSVELELEFVTPCFLGGADRRARAEWRAASIRGQLRWWFRAVAGGHFQGQLEPVRMAEENLFGSTNRASALRVRALGSPEAFPAGDRSTYGRGLDETDLAKRWGDSPTSPATLRRLQLKAGRGNPIEYLGYGCLLRNKEVKATLIEHGGFEAGEKATVELQWRRGLSESERTLLFNALWCWLNLGGIGARSRRGFGSLRCLTSTGDPLFDAKRLGPKGRGAFGQQLKEILPPLEEASPGTALPAWSHLSGQTRVYWSKDRCDTWEDAMMRLGGWLIAFRRRYGSARHVDPRLDPSGSPRDYDWAAPHGTSPGGGIPDRAGFGLPLPFGQDGDTVTWGSAGKDARRASPLLLHICRFDKPQPDGTEYLPVLTYIPAALVPPGEKLFLKKHGTSAPSRPEQERIVGRFLDDLAAHGLIKEARA